MNKTGNREQGTGNNGQGTGNNGAELVTAIAPARAQLTLAEVRAKLDGKTGKRFWKNLDELAETPGFHEMLEQEFPRQAGAGEWVDAVSRRGFLKVMGASLALAGLAGCTKQPDEPIFPYVKAPEDLILGKPMYFATAHPFPTGAIPVLVKSDAFRPIKVDGNPDHPMTKGKSDPFTQATLLDLYDPDRSKEVRLRGEPSEYADFQEAFTDALKASKDGTGIYFLSETITSPTLAAQWKQVQAKFPQAKLVQWEPVNRDAAMAASKAALPARKRGRDPVAGCGLPGRDRASGISADGGGVRGAASLRSWQDHEPDVRRRDHADGDRVQGRSQAGAEAE
jgi:molybdopterin-containing oxidoreductase family iron-sulfur binding subunit